MRIQKETQYTIVLDGGEYEILMLALRHVIALPPKPPYTESTMTCVSYALAELDEYA